MLTTIQTLLQNKTGNFTSCDPVNHENNTILFRDTVMTMSYDGDYVYITSTHFGFIKWSYFTIDDQSPRYLPKDEPKHGKLHITMLTEWKTYIPEPTLSDHDFYCFGVIEAERPWQKLIDFRMNEGLDTVENQHYVIQKVHGYWKVYMEVGSCEFYGHGPSIRDAQNTLARKYLAYYADLIEE